jgi:hypothetical protein
MEPEMRANIRELVQSKYLSLPKYPDQHALSLLVMQVEAFFAFSICRSALYSQQAEPRIVELYKKYGVRASRPPIVEPEPSLSDQYEVPLSTRERRVGHENKREAIKGGVPGNVKFLGVIKLIMDQTHDIILKFPLFELPTELSDDSLTYVLSQPDFAQFNKRQLRQKLSKFPVEMAYISKIQALLTQRFENMLHNKWLESIVKAIERVMREDFASESQKLVRSSDQINPYLLRFLTFADIYLERIIFDKMKAAMQKYLKFVLNFAAR